ncbi:MAG: hypothetical protein U0872_11340 [Planctomycetaceae bacterium]
MSVRRFFYAAISLVLTAFFLIAAFVTPGVRHQHEGGEHSHTHSSSKTHAHHHHGHSHHHHGHAHSHAHHHHHHHAAIAESSPHIHVSIFGFQLTLPDFFGGVDAPVTASTPAVRSHAKSKPPAVPEIRALEIFPQLVRFVMDLRCLVPSKVMLAASLTESTRFAAWERVDFGRTRPEPMVPPPKTA